MGIIAEQWQLEEPVQPHVQPSEQLSAQPLEPAAALPVQLSVQRAVGVTRLTGLLRRSLPGAREGLLLTHCRAVHTIGMRESIDVVFLDRENRVRRVRCLAPHRLAVCRVARSVLELRAGEAARLGVASGSRIVPSPTREVADCDD